MSDYWRGLIGRRGTAPGSAQSPADHGRPIPLYLWRGSTEMVLNYVGKNADRFRRQIIQEVADAIRGKSGPDYLRLAQCIEVLKKQS